MLLMKALPALAASFSFGNAAGIRSFGAVGLASMMAVKVEGKGGTNVEGDVSVHSKRSALQTSHDVLPSNFISKRRLQVALAVPARPLIPANEGGKYDVKSKAKDTFRGLRAEEFKPKKEETSFVQRHVQAVSDVDVFPGIPVQELAMFTGSETSVMILVSNDGTVKTLPPPNNFVCESTKVSVDYKRGVVKEGGDTLFFYTLAVAGDDASLTLNSHLDQLKNSVVYFSTNATVCSPKYEINHYQVWDPQKEEGKSKRVCFKATKDTQIGANYGGLPVVHAEVLTRMKTAARGEFTFVSSTISDGKYFTV